MRVYSWRSFVISVGVKLGVALAVLASALPPQQTGASETDQLVSILPASSQPTTFFGARSDFGTAGDFRFITPIASNPHDMGANFDADILPYLTVNICKVSGSECSSITSFTSVTSPDRIRIEKQQGHYFIVNWATGPSFDNTPVYRISVEVPGETLGTIDLPPSAYRQWGRTWPIKFIIEKDPELRIRLLTALGLSLWEIANILRSELGICDAELAGFLLSTYPDATAEQVGQVVDGVCQDVVLAPNAKIADAATRDSLSFYDQSTGRMEFAYETNTLKRLRTGDVLVSQPSPAAQYGYLRKVTAIRRAGSGYVVDSVQAKLTEAISKGNVNASGELSPAPTGLAGQPLVLSKKTNDSRSLGAAIDEGDGFKFDQAIDVTVNFDGSEDGVEGSGSFRVQGNVYFNAGYNVGIGIEPCFAIPPACVDRFEAWAGGEFKSKLRVTANFNGRVSKEKVIAPVPLSPIVFFIGPIPVVLVPKINVILGVNGEASIDFVFEAKAESAIKVGAKWTEDEGWRDISEFNLFDGEVIETKLEADLRLEAYAKVDAKILLYNVVGPGMDLSIGAEVDVETGRKPFWRIRGHVVTNVKFEVGIEEIVDVDVYSQAILNEWFEIAESVNAPPIFANVRDGAIQARVNRAVYVGPDDGLAGKNYDVFDPEGDIPQLTVTAPDGVVSGLRVTYSTPGLKTVKITARDSEGLTRDLYLGVDVRNSPPIVTITPDSGEIPAATQYWLNATAYDPEEGTLRCSRLTWSATGAHTKNVSQSDRTCTAVFKFNEPGLQTVTVSAMDSLGATMLDQHNVIVGEAPEVPYPEIVPDSFSIQAISRIRRLGDDPFEIGCLPGALCEVETGDFIYNGYGGDFIPPLIMRLEATDPSGAPLIIDWRCETGQNSAPVTYNGDGSYSCTPIYSALDPIRVYAYIYTPPPPFGEGTGPVTKSEVRTYYMLQAPN